MKKIILSALAVLGASAFVAPAQAQVGGSVTGAFAATNTNGSVSTIAAEVVYPASVYATSGIATATALLDTATIDGNAFYSGAAALTVAGGGVTSTGANGAATVEGATVNLFNSVVGGADFDRVAIIKAWRSGGLD